MTIQDDKFFSKSLYEARKRDPSLIMCVVNNQKADTYSVIKKMGCVEGIPTQVLVARTIKREDHILLSICTKILIQINTKLGGVPWMVSIPPKGMMVVGFDVTHDTRDKSKSYGAMVATMDMRLKQNFFSTVSPHKNGEELSNYLAIDICKAINARVKQHETLPENIFIFRDGVGDGQVEYVRAIEVDAILSRLKQIYNGAEFGLIFAIVSKKSNTRFFKDRENPSPGTIVDNGVTLPER